MYTKREVIVVRYLTNNKEYPYSRPHKVQKITNDGKVKYFTLNNSSEIDPKLFTTNWPRKNKGITPKTSSQSAIWEQVLIKFPKKEGQKKSRVKKAYKITLGNVIEYAPFRKGTRIRYNPKDFITEWEKGPQITPKASRKYPKEYLLKLGYSEELITVIKRGYTSKNIDSICKKLGSTRQEARELLDKHGCVSKVLENNKELYEEIKETRKKAQENVNHMGKFTHKKPQISAKPNSRRYRKMLKKGQINKAGYWIKGKPKNPKKQRSKKR